MPKKVMKCRVRHDSDTRARFCQQGKKSQLFLALLLVVLAIGVSGYTSTRMVQARGARRGSTAFFGSSNVDGDGDDSGYMVRPYGPGSGGPVGMFGGRGGLTSTISADRELSDVLIEAPSMQSRRISATILVEDDVDEVWRILTDYNNLASHVPNLVQSYVVEAVRGRYEYKNSNFGGSAGRNTRGALLDENGAPVVTDVTIFQEGAQKILGFDFRASLKMDMKATPPSFSPAAGGAVTSRKLTFTLADSFMFSAFDGSWTVGSHSREELSNGKTKVRSQLTYSVLVKPRGPVPVAALEWRIKEDVPVNLLAVKKAVETKAYYKVGGRGSDTGNWGRSNLPIPTKAGAGNAVPRMTERLNSGATANRRRGGGKDPRDNSGYWDADETLENYLT